MSESRVTTRNKETVTSRCLATIRVASDSEAVPVPPVLPSPSSGQQLAIKVFKHFKSCTTLSKSLPKIKETSL